MNTYKIGKSRFEKGYKCSKCGGSHHIFTFSPSMKVKVASCGQLYMENNREARKRLPVG